MCREEHRAISLIVKRGIERRHEEARIKEGEILRRFQSLCRNVIAAFFYRPRGIANGLSGPPCTESLRAFYRSVAAGVTPADLDFLLLPRNVYFGVAEIFRDPCTLVIYFPAD